LFFVLEQNAFNLQLEYLREFIEKVMRGKMKEINPKDMIFDELEDTELKSAKPGHHYSDANTKSARFSKLPKRSFVDYGVAGPSNPCYGTGSSIEDAIDLTIKEEEEEHEKRQRYPEKYEKRQRYPGKHEKGQRDPEKHAKGQRDPEKHEKKQRGPDIPKYYYMSDIDKDHLTILKVSNIFILSFSVAIH
jgi:hypothetical protein